MPLNASVQTRADDKTICNFRKDNAAALKAA
jgi:hypothetical protein